MRLFGKALLGCALALPLAMCSLGRWSQLHTDATRFLLLLILATSNIGRDRLLPSTERAIRCRVDDSIREILAWPDTGVSPRKILGRTGRPPLHTGCQRSMSRSERCPLARHLPGQSSCRHQAGVEPTRGIRRMATNILLGRCTMRVGRQSIVWTVHIKPVTARDGILAIRHGIDQAKPKAPGKSLDGPHLEISPFPFSSKSRRSLVRHYRFRFPLSDRHSKLQQSSHTFRLESRRFHR